MNSSRYLDLTDLPRVVDFLVEQLGYLDEPERKPAHDFIKKYQEGGRLSPEKAAEVARKIAVASWPARYAVTHWLTREAPQEEFRLVAAAVRPSTAYLLARLKQGIEAKTLDDLLKHSDTATALRDEELSEISHVRVNVREHVWKEKRAGFIEIVKNGGKELASYHKRLKKLRELSNGLPALLEDEVYSKISYYEDRIFFGGETLPLEILDEEISYYTDQKEISPIE